MDEWLQHRGQNQEAPSCKKADPSGGGKGNRLFTKQDLDNLRIIYHLVKERGYTLQGAKDKLRQNKDEVLKQVEIIDSLNQMKGFLLELKEQM